MRRAEELPQLRDLPLHLRHRRDRCGTGIESSASRSTETTRFAFRSRIASVARCFRPAEPNRAGLADDLERAEDAEVEHGRRTVTFGSGSVAAGQTIGPVRNTREKRRET